MRLINKIKLVNLKAFTLIELLLGLSLFAVIGLVVYSTFASGIRLSRSFDAENDAYREVRMTFELLSKELENAVAYDFSGSYPDLKALKGEQNKIMFLSADHDQLKFIEYSLNKPTDARIYQTIIGKVYSKNVSLTLKDQLNQRINYLIREEHGFADYLKNNSRRDSDFEIISTHIMEGSLKFSFGYFEGQDAKELSWQNEWNEQILPKAVKVEADFLIEHSDKHSEDSNEMKHFSQVIVLPAAEGIKEKPPA